MIRTIPALLAALAISLNLFSQTCPQLINEEPSSICLGETLELTTTFPLNSSSLSFDGVDDWIEIPYHEQLNMVGEGFSLIAWFKSESQSGRQNIISMPSSTWASHGSYCLYIEDGWLRFTIRETLEAPWYAHLITEQFSLGEWHQVVATADPLQGEMKLYLDGELIGTKDDWSGAMYQDASEPLMIGVQYKEDYPGQYFAPFDGELDDINVIEKVLDPIDVELLYQCPYSISTIPETVARWSFNEGSETSVMSTNEDIEAGIFVGQPSWSYSVPHSGIPFTYAWSTGHVDANINYQVNATDPVTLSMTDGQGFTYNEDYELEVLGTPLQVQNHIVCIGADFVTSTGDTIHEVLNTEVVMEEYTDANGCDSIIKHIIVPDDLNVDITLEETTFHVNEVADTYDWYHCRPEAVFLTQLTEPIYEATEGGEYMVVVSRGECKDTSDCVTLIYPTSGLLSDAQRDSEQDISPMEVNKTAAIRPLETRWKISPNPTDAPVTISAEMPFDAYRILNYQGVTVIQEEFIKTQMIVGKIPYTVGSYLIQIRTEEKWSSPKRLVRF